MSIVGDQGRLLYFPPGNGNSQTEMSLMFPPGVILVNWIFKYNLKDNSLNYFNFDESNFV